jgi:exodeoxyribonuclease V gamma subunit
VLHVHHANRADRLVVALAAVLAVPPPDPFTADVVAVHSRGQERWLAQQLALRLGTSTGSADGIAANLEFPFPGRLVGDAIARATGLDPAADPWRTGRLVWRLLDVVAATDDPGLLGPLSVHLTEPDGSTSDRRFAAVHRVADLFDRYAIHRPDLLRSWADGRDVDGVGGPLPAGARWQAALWRALRHHLGEPSPAERLDAACQALREGRDLRGEPLRLDLPDRISLFGLTSLPATYVAVLDAIAAGATPDAPDGREVHLFLLHPSPVLWRRVDEYLGPPLADPGPLPQREDDETRELARHPLLATWGRDAREMQLVVRRASTARFHPSTVAPRDDGAGNDGHDGEDAGNAECGGEGAGSDGTGSLPLLHRLQEAIRDDRAVPAPGGHETRPVLANDDRSVQFHRCHGRTRQVEVLRDVLLHLLADVPALEPRDIVVMCPDIETFAPLIEAVFGAHAAADDGPDLRVQLADRSLRRTNAVLRVVAELLELGDSRLTASAVLDLCHRAPVRHRFGFDDDDLTRLERWLADSGVRWGLDAGHRLRVGVPTGANTWRSGLDRLLVGVAVADEGLRTVGDVVPVDDVEGGDVDLAGRLAELLARLDRITHELAVARPIEAWRDVIADAADALCDTDDDDSWQRVQLGRALDEVVEAATGRPATGDATGLGADRPVPGVELSLPEVRSLLEDRLRGGASRASHRTGDLTICTLVPMRSVPHRAVVLLGLDDEVFPRRTSADGDDLLAHDPVVGDRDPRTEDRQLLLDALLAANDRLVVISTGHDERTNERTPPAVPIGELLDVIDRTVRVTPTDPAPIGGGAGAAPSTASDAITTDHPLQPFDARRFTPGRLGVDGESFGFDLLDLDAAEARAGGQQEPTPFLDGPLPPLDEDVVDLHDLVDFFLHPCRELLRQRLQVTFASDGDVLADALPVELEKGLPEWQLGAGLLRHVVAGADVDRALDLEKARGALPPGELGTERIEEVRRNVDELVYGAREFGVELGADVRAVPIDLSLPDGRRLVGAVDGVVETTRLAVTYSRLGPKHRLQAWIELLALIAQDPAEPWAAMTLGRARRGAPGGKNPTIVSRSLLGPRDATHLREGTDAGEVPCALGPSDAGDLDRQRCAIDLLVDLIQLRDRGLCEGLPLPCETAAVYADERWDNAAGTSRRDPLGNAARTWDTGDFGRYDQADRDPANRQVLGELTFEDLRRLPPTEHEAGDGWFSDREAGRFGRLARRVWWPLRSSELVEDRA